eukprot:COSAG03_NODE_1517_length_3945_cov_2.769371_4_plen_89_part_00
MYFLKVLGSDLPGSAAARVKARALTHSRATSRAAPARPAACSVFATTLAVAGGSIQSSRARFVIANVVVLYCIVIWVKLALYVSSIYV